MNVHTVCRICKTVGVRLHCITDRHLREIYERNSGTSLPTEDNKPSLACITCCDRLQHCYQESNSCEQRENAPTMMVSDAEYSNENMSATSPVEHPNNTCAVQRDVHKCIKMEPKEEITTDVADETWQQNDLEEDNVNAEIGLMPRIVHIKSERTIPDETAPNEITNETNESLNIPDESKTRLRTCKTAPEHRESVSSNENEEPFSPAVSEYAPSLNPSRSSSPLLSSSVRDVNLALTAGCAASAMRSHNNDLDFSNNLLLPSTGFASDNSCSQNDNSNTNIIKTANCHTNVDQSVIGDIASSSRALLTTESHIKCRKRTRNTEQRSKCKQKKNKNNALEYHSKDIKLRQLGSPCECKMKCVDTFTQANRSEIFQHYWHIGDHEKQWLYILNYIQVEQPKVIKVQRKRDRSRTLTYYLPFNKDANVTKLRVCKVMFLNTLGIKEKTVYSAMNKYTNNLQIKDLRGKHANRPHKTSDEIEQSVIQHIQSFPCIESHYLRKQTSQANKKGFNQKRDIDYLASDLNLAKMHRLYALWMSENLNTVKVASLYQYSNIFNSQFNLSFFKPNKDMCQICSIYENADPGRKIELQDNYESHLKNKLLVRKIKDEEKSSSNPETKTVAVFDLEKVLNLPQSNEAIFHYKRKYPVYNFTVYNLLSSQGYCFVWHAQIAKRGANEISSCLFEFFKKEAQNGIKSVSLYSDNCSGQKIHRFILAMYLHASRTLNMEIVHRFLQTGHTQTEGDCMHACVEKNLKNKIVYTPDQLYAVITNAKVHKRFVVTEMSQDLFYDFKSLAASNNNWLRDTRGKKVYFSKLKEVKVTPEAPSKLFYKYDFEQNAYFELDTKSFCSRTRKTQPVPSELKTAYKDLLPVSAALYQDLTSLCDSNAIPLHYQGFYRSLATDDTRHLLPSDNSDED